MKVGVYAANISKHLGGGYTFQDTILEELLKTQSKHEFNIYYENANYSFNDVITANKVELVWFPNTYCIPVKLPFIMTVLDIEHRMQPYFPEVSYTGWTWEDREEFFKNTKKASYVVTGTHIAKQQLMQFYGIPSERISILPHPTPTFALYADTTKVSKTFEANLSKNYIFYPAQFWPHKNHIGLLYALKVLNEKYHMNMSLVLSGTDKGNLQYIKSVVQQLGLEDKVQFLGFVSTHELVYLYKHAFALVYVSFYGPENLPPLETFALCCPVVASIIQLAIQHLKATTNF